MDYIKRIIDDEIDRRAEAFNAISITWTKGVWKDENSKRKM